MKLRCSLLALSLTVTAGAQNIHVVPQDLAIVDGPAMLSAPGIGIARRLQLVIGDTELQAIVGRRLTGVMLRRDTSWPDALPATTGQIVVRIGHAAQPPERAARSFAGNLPSPVTVYRGAIAAPASTASPSAPSWSATDSIRIDFTQAFTYSGGPLGLEFDAPTSAGVWWPVDATSDPARGSDSTAGSACGRLTQVVETAGVRDSGLVVGRTARFHLIGEPLAPAWLLVGFGILRHPIDLTVFGAPGCEMYLSPITAVPSSLSPAIHGLDESGLANVDIHIPADTGLFGTQIATQWVELVPPSFVTSNAVLCQVATIPPMLPITMIVSRAGEQPDVVSAGVPVLGLLWQ